MYTMLLISSMVFYACTDKQSVRTDTLIRQWQFTQDTTENPVWQEVTIPHDWLGNQRSFRPCERPAGGDRGAERRERADMENRT